MPESRKKIDPWKDPCNTIELHDSAVACALETMGSFFRMFEDPDDMRIVGRALMKHVRSSIYGLIECIERDIGPIEILFKPETDIGYGVDPTGIIAARIKPASQPGKPAEEEEV